MAHLAHPAKLMALESTCQPEYNDWYEMIFMLAIHVIPTHSYRSDVTHAIHGVIKFVVVLKTN